MVSVNLGAMLALTSIPQVTHSQLQSAACIPQAQAVQLFIFTLPDMADGIIKKCGPALAPTAFINRSNVWLAGYRAKADAAWPQARAAFMTMAGPGVSKVGLSDDVLRPLVSSVIGAVASKEIKPESCGTANTVMEALAPLPPENIASIIVAVALTGKDNQDDELKICKD